MSISVTQVQIVIFACPCARACRLQPPPDELADRLRREVQQGRDCQPIHLHGVADDMFTTFDAQRN